MKVVLVIVFAVALMVVFGWLTFSQTGDRARINIETQEIKDDTKKAVEEASKLTEGAGKKGREVIRDLDKRDRDATRNEPQENEPQKPDDLDADPENRRKPAEAPVPQTTPAEPGPTFPE
jgi:hypothetical protein